MALFRYEIMNVIGVKNKGHERRKFFSIRDKEIVFALQIRKHYLLSKAFICVRDKKNIE